MTQLFFIQKPSPQNRWPIQDLSSSQFLELKQPFLVIHRKGPSLSITTIFKYKILLNKANKYFLNFSLLKVWIKLLITNEQIVNKSKILQNTRFMEP